MTHSLPISTLYSPDRFVVLRTPATARWLMTAAELGDADARAAVDTFLTVYDKRGEPLPEDRNATQRWLERAAALGSADAKAALGQDAGPAGPRPATPAFPRPVPPSPPPASALEPIPDRPVDPDDSLAPPEFRTLRQVPGLSDLTRKRLITYADHCRVGAMGRTKGPPSLLMYGPPGTGKTMLGAVIARHAGRRFIYANISEWDAAGPLSDHLTAMRVAFFAAADAEPCLFFLDEIDRFAPRQASGHYHIQVVNAMLELVTSLRSRADVAIVAATNLPTLVDTALIRPGRLGDTKLEIPYPDQKGVRSLIAHLVPQLSESELGRFSLQFGNTSPADIVMWVEQARATAALDHLPLSRRHLQEAFEQIAGIDSVNPGQVFRVAVHELGHATVARALHSLGAIESISVRPTLSGALGTTLTAPAGVDYARSVRLNSQDAWIDELAILMGGYTAERLFLSAYGGASSGTSEDFERCRKIAAEMVASGLIITQKASDSPFAGQHPALMVEKILDTAYRKADSVLETITHQAMFAAANKLTTAGFLSGNELRDVLGKLLTSSPAPRRE